MIPEDVQSSGHKDLEPESCLSVARVLGLHLDTNEDVFTVQQERDRDRREAPIEAENAQDGDVFIR
jgi:hypothetical protein